MSNRNNPFLDPSSTRPEDGSPREDDHTQPAFSRPRHGQLKVPFQWDIALIEHMGEINRREDTLHPVAELYASDRFTQIGSGRPANSLRERQFPVETYVAECRRFGLALDYVLNPPILTPEEIDGALQMVDALVSEGVETFTVGNPLLAAAMRRRFSALRLTLSVNGKLDSCEKVRQAVEMTGVDSILLDNRCSRNFPLMRQIRREFPSLLLAILGTESCLPDCFLQLHHQCHLAQCSKIGGFAEDVIDWPHILCARMKLMSPSYVMKAPWIRPQDAVHVFDAGVDMIKIAGRTQPTSWIVEATTAYATGRHAGDLWHLIEKSGLSSPDWEGVLKRKLPPVRYHVESESLDGFIQPFVNGTVPCVKGALGCEGCRWCDRWTAKAVTVPENVGERLHDLEELTDIIVGRAA